MLPGDSEVRAYAKWCQLLYNVNGPGEPTPFPEGNAPFPGDDGERLAKKINALIGTTGAGEGGGGGGGGGIPPVGDIAIVQMETFASSVDDPVDFQFGFISQCTLGNLLVLCVVCDFTVPTPSGWTLAQSAIDATGTYIFYRISDGSEQNFTITPGAPAPGCCVAFEISGCAAAPFDKSASATGQGAGSTIATGTTALTSQADEILIALVGIGLSGGDTAAITAWSNSFVEQAQVTSSAGSPANIRMAVATRTVTAAATYTTTATLSAADAACSGAIATFKKV